MQLDTSSSLTIILYSDNAFIRHFGGKKLSGTKVVMKTYSGEKLKSFGYNLVNVRLNVNAMS